MREILQELRHAVRVHASTPAVTLVAVLTLAFGIGANTAVFSFADEWFGRSLPLPESDRVVAVAHVSVKDARNRSQFSLPDFEELQRLSASMSGLSAWSELTVRLGDSAVERVSGEIVSGDYFDTLGVPMALGRGFLREEDRTTGTHPVVVLAHQLWTRAFSGDASVLGQTAIINGRPFTVVGVTAEAFRGLEASSSPQLWVPLRMHDVVMPTFRAFGKDLFGNRGTHWLNVVGRLRPGISIAQSEDDLRRMATQQALDNPQTNRDWTVDVMPANEVRLGYPGDRAAVTVTGLISVVVGLVLLIACANVANMLLARGVSRRRELAIRLAVGADRARLIRQLLAESLVLSIAGGAAGLVMAGVTMRFLSLQSVTTSFPGIEWGVDRRVLGFAVVLALITGVISGLLPAWRQSVVDVLPALKSSQAPALGVGRRRSMGRGLVIVQVALCMVLLVGAGLALRTVLNLQTLPMGFAFEHVWLAQIDTSEREYPADRVRQVLRDVTERVQRLPGVEAADLGLMGPFGSRRMANDIFWEPTEGGERGRTNVDMNVVGSEYFAAMGIPVTRGRAFAATDTDGAIVNDTLARRLWPGADPIGRRVWSWNPDGNDRPLTVVGVVPDGRYYRSWRMGGRPFLFVPFPAWSQPAMTLHIRMAPGATLHESTVAGIVRAVDANVPPPEVQKVTGVRARSLALERTNAVVLLAFGALAALIAAAGIYGVISFSVSARTKELGLRMALGASRNAILRQEVAAGLRPVMVGVVIGGTLAVWLARLVAHLFFGVTPGDPATLLAVAVLLISAGALASLMPARRATHVDPLVALRND